MDTQSKNKFLYGAIILLLVLNFGTLSFMWYGRLKQPKEIPPPPPPSHVSGKEFLDEQLKFTKQQSDSVGKLREAHFKSIEKTREEGKALHEAFFENLTKIEADSNRINEIAAQIGMNQKMIELATYKHFAAIRNLCDDTQKKKFDEIIQDVLRIGPGGPPNGPANGPPGMQPPPRRDGYKQRDGDGHINPPGIPEGKENLPKK